MLPNFRSSFWVQDTCYIGVSGFPTAPFRESNANDQMLLQQNVTRPSKPGQPSVRVSLAAQIIDPPFNEGANHRAWRVSPVEGGEEGGVYGGPALPPVLW